MTNVTITDPQGRQVRLHGDRSASWPGDLMLGSVGGESSPPVWRGERQARLGSGWVLGPVTRDGRPIDVSGWAHVDGGSTAELRAAVRVLAASINSLWSDDYGGLGEWLLVSDGDYYRSAAVRPEPGADWLVDTSLAHLGWLRFELHLLAPDPYLYGRPRPHTLPMTSEGVGLKFPWFAPVDAGFMAFGTPAHQPPLLVNNGNAPAWPVYEVRGDLPQGFTIEQAGRTVSFGEAVFAASPVTVDMAGRVLVAGVDRTSAATVREWASIPPGGTVEPALTVPAGVASAQVTVRDTWM